MGLLDSLKGIFGKKDVAPTEGPTTTPDATALNTSTGSEAPVGSTPAAPEMPADPATPAPSTPEAPAMPPAEPAQDAPVDPTAQPQQ